MFGEMVSYPGVDGPVEAFITAPDRVVARPAVIVIHEIWGLTDHIKQVAGRFATSNYVAIAPNLFNRKGLAEMMQPDNLREVMNFTSTIAREQMSDPDYIQIELNKLAPETRERVQKTLPALTGGIPRERLLQDLIRAVDFLRSLDFVNGKIGSIGFCFGGGMSINLACRAKYDGAVVFYGENPNPIELVEQIACPVMGIYGGEDMRINSHLAELVQAMVAYKKDYSLKLYPGAPHAFFNDTNLTHYRPEQAADAWERVQTFFEKNLKGK